MRMACAWRAHDICMVFAWRVHGVCRLARLCTIVRFGEGRSIRNDSPFYLVLDGCVTCVAVDDEEAAYSPHPRPLAPTPTHPTPALARGPGPARARALVQGLCYYSQEVIAALAGRNGRRVSHRRPSSAASTRTELTLRRQGVQI